jgi:hypothetical protein
MDKVLLIENLKRGRYAEVNHVVSNLINHCWAQKLPLPALKIESNGDGWRLTVPEELVPLLPVVPQKGYAWEEPTIDAATADNAVVSMGDDAGAFVQAWAWCSDSEVDLPRNGDDLCDTCLESGKEIDHTTDGKMVCVECAAEVA